MKVLHIEAGKNLYGGALQVWYLLQELQEQHGAKIDNSLICPIGCELATRASAVATVFPIEMNGDLDFRQQSRIAAVIAAVKPDLVHIHSRRGADLWGLLAARRANVPVICSRRVDNPEPTWLAKWKYHKYHVVVTISEAIRRVLIREGVSPERIVCVPSAVDTERYAPLADIATKTRENAWFRAEFGLDEDAVVIANFAQMIPRKGQSTLIKAFAQLHLDHPQARLLLFGKGPRLDAYRACAEQCGVADKVLFPGFRGDIHRILPNVDIVAHPATMEGLGVALLQSASAGVPIVATCAGGIPEIVADRKNGFLVDVGNTSALTLRLQQLLENPELRLAQGKHGRTKVLSAFSISAMAAGNYRVYQTLLR